MIDSIVQEPNTVPTVVIPPVDLPSPTTEVRDTGPPAWLGKMLKWLFPVAALLFIALIAIPNFLQKWLWMRQLDYAGIFWTLFAVKVGLVCAAFAFAAAFLWLNVRWAALCSGAKSTAVSRHRWVKKRARTSSSPPWQNP